MLIEFCEADQEDWIDDDDCSIHCELLREPMDELNQAIHPLAEKNPCCTQLLMHLKEKCFHQFKTFKPNTSANKLLIVVIVVLVVFLCRMLPVHAVHHVDDILQVRDECHNLIIRQALHVAKFIVLGHKCDPSLGAVALVLHAFGPSLASGQTKKCSIAQLNCHIVALHLHQLAL